MELLKMSTGVDCLVTSFAMVLAHKEIDTPAFTVRHRLIHCIGHNDPVRGHDLQEIIDALFPLFTVVRIDWMPIYSVPGQLDTDLWPKAKCEERCARYLKNYTGVLLGTKGPYGHACAWDGQHVYDPIGKITTVEESDLASMSLCIVR